MAVANGKNGLGLFKPSSHRNHSPFSIEGLGFTAVEFFVGTKSRVSLTVVVVVVVDRNATTGSLRYVEDGY